MSIRRSSRSSVFALTECDTDKLDNRTSSIVLFASEFWQAWESWINAGLQESKRVSTRGLQSIMHLGNLTTFCIQVVVYLLFYYLVSISLCISGHERHSRRYTVNKKLIRRWDSERELFLRRHRTRNTKYNRLVHKFRHRSMQWCWNACLPNLVK